MRLPITLDYISCTSHLLSAAWTRVKMQRQFEEPTGFTLSEWRDLSSP